MKTQSFFSSRAGIACRLMAHGLVALLGGSYLSPVMAQAALADQPVFAGADVPGNLALALSVEFPTAISVANIGNYADSSTYLGYFDPAKCYTYIKNVASPPGSYFQPVSPGIGTNGHQCAGLWSGNFMNWASMQTIDPFRWALSGGYRDVDTASQTILEKAWGPNASDQGSAAANFNYRGTDRASNNYLNASVGSVTPFTNWAKFDSGIWGNGNMMVFTGSGNQSDYSLPATNALVNELSDVAVANTDTGSKAVYKVYIRVRVCDATTTLGTAGLESNCVKYGTNYKPEGLIQQYSNKIRYGAISYLNQDGLNRQGGVLREPMGFVGPTYPQPLSTTVITNTRPEWNATDGTMIKNPDVAASGASGVSQSGVMNFLNKFGRYSQHYMRYDNVSELYYAALRYYENLGNVPEWSSSPTLTQLDDFPAAATWADPIAYSCQKNFILGIGDDHTWYDYNVGGSTYAPGTRPKPAAVASDTFNQASTWTASMQALEGITPNPRWPFDSGATYFIAGLAYGAHVLDIRPDLTGSQTISTFWMDVEEGGGPENLNPYYLAAKYGGFTVPAAGYSITNTTPLALGSWDTTGSSIVMNGNQTHYQPDNYFLAGNANAMVAGLKSAFTNIANAIKAFTTSLAFSAANVSTSGTVSFAAQFDSTGWTGVVTASTLTFDTNGNPVTTPDWSSTTKLQTQLAGTGWQTGRRVVTWNGSAGVPFNVANLTSSQLSALLPAYSSATTSAQYLNYLRGDQTNEVGSTATGSTKSLRTRTLLLGDIVDAALSPVEPPSQQFSDATNPGYAAFKTQWTTTTPRPAMVYAGANDGMLHAFVGTTGVEQFAYVPSALFQGPNNTPQVDGLAQLGNPNYNHHYYVDATPIAYDIDLNRTGGNPNGTGSPNWRTLLIGGLGKGGKSYYAIDVTDPASMTSESAVAGKILWEFTDSSMGYSFGAPLAFKTLKYGWVIGLTSGYNNSDGYGYLYLINPSNGALLEKIKTPSASSGLTQADAFINDYTNSTSDSVYVGDLNGQLWRFDLTGTSGSYPAPTQIATLTDASGTAQPVTTAPLIEIHPTTRKRYVMVGTGRLLASTDVVSTAVQSFYVVLDGNAGGFPVVSTPATRSVMTPVTNSGLTAGITLSPLVKGWYLDLGTDSTSGIAYRMVINPSSYNGIVSFATLLTSGDACSPSGKGRAFALDYSTATSVLLPSPTPYIDFSTSIISDRVVGVGAGNKAEFVVSGADGTNSKLPTSPLNALATRILNWRELPTVE